MCVGSQNRHHQLTVRAHSVDVLLLKVNINTQHFQLTHGLQQGDRIPGKSRNRLSDNQIDVPGSAFGKKALEISSVFFGASEGLVCVYAAVEPSRMLLNHFAVKADLCRKRM